jgi:hypothetical protein
MPFDQPLSGALFLLISKFSRISKISDLTLSRAWSLSIGRLPHFSRDTKLATKPAIVDHVESSAWIPYTDDGKYLYPRQVLMLINLRGTVRAVMYTAVKRPQRLQNLLRALRDRPQIFIHAILPRNTRDKQITPRNIHPISELVRRNTYNLATGTQLHPSSSLRTVSPTLLHQIPLH